MEFEELKEYLDSYITIMNLSHEYFFRYSHLSLWTSSSSDYSNVISVLARVKKTSVYGLPLYSIYYSKDKKLRVNLHRDITSNKEIYHMIETIDSLSEFLAKTSDVAIEYCDSIYFK